MSTLSSIRVSIRLDSTCKNHQLDAVAKSSRRNTLRWIKLAKTPATRAKRVQKTATLVAQNKQIPGI
ncbi:MAG: YdeI/OmpD-associated family protein [Leptolyngbyaceae cyanobacterium]